MTLSQTDPMLFVATALADLPADPGDVTADQFIHLAAIVRGLTAHLDALLNDLLPIAAGIEATVASDAEPSDDVIDDFEWCQARIARAIQARRRLAPYVRSAAAARGFDADALATAPTS